MKQLGGYEGTPSEDGSHANSRSLYGNCSKDVCVRVRSEGLFGNLPGELTPEPRVPLYGVGDVLQFSSARP